MTLMPSMSIQSINFFVSRIVSRPGGMQMVPPAQSGTKMSLNTASKAGVVSWLTRTPSPKPSAFIFHLFRDLRPHVVSLGNNGELRPGGAYGTDANDVKRIFREDFPGPCAVVEATTTPALRTWGPGERRNGGAACGRLPCRDAAG